MTLLITLAGILLTIFFVIGTHEAAHFFAARLLGIKVLRFSIGFGKSLYRWHDRSGTEYVLAWIPLGGYVQMLDEHEGSVPQNEVHLAFNRQPYYKKLLVVLAGPFANIFWAFLLYWLVFIIGFTTIKPIIGGITPRSIAAEAGLTANHEIIAIDSIPIKTWNSVLFRIITHAGNQDHLKIDVQTVCPPLKTACHNKRQTHLLDLSNWHMDGLMPDPLKSLGIAPYQPDIPLIIGFIKDDSPAAKAHLQLGDKILAFNRMPVKDWEELITQIVNNPEKKAELHILRKGQLKNINIEIGAQHNLFWQKSGYLGIGPNFVWPKELLQKVQYDPIAAVPHAYQTIIDFTHFNFLLFGKMITGKLSLKSLGGPIMIFESAGNALNAGMVPFLSFLAFLSVSIGVINLIPIPGLDGGHILIQTIELILRKPLPEKALLFLFRLGFLFILFMLMQAIVNDILRLS